MKGQYLWGQDCSCEDRAVVVGTGLYLWGQGSSCGAELYLWGQGSSCGGRAVFVGTGLYLCGVSVRVMCDSTVQRRSLPTG